MRRSLLIVVLVAVATATAVGFVPANVPTATAADSAKCSQPTGPFKVQYCPLTSGNVPVWKLETHQIVDRLDQGGSENWFICQAQGETHWLDGRVTNWWAWTMGDDGKWGWVSLVYFAGGSNFEPDGGLRRC